MVHGDDTKSGHRPTHGYQLITTSMNGSGFVGNFFVIVVYELR